MHWTKLSPLGWGDFPNFVSIGINVAKIVWECFCGKMLAYFAAFERTNHNSKLENKELHFTLENVGLYGIKVSLL